MLVPTIGIEVHVELKSDLKVFSNSPNEFNSAPNTNINEIDLAYPGTLPTLNKEVIEMALKAALILNCKINKEMHFDRKNYFYPDLPKGYQITQFDTPIGYDGYIDIEIDDKVKRIDIERIHIEEDTCKSIHVKDLTFLNYNRAGVPLIEIVTKPVIENSKEAVLYLEALREKLLYLEISDVKIEEGSMRCDANVSLKEAGSTLLGIKSEIKNIGSITKVGVSIDYEIERQKELINKGIILKEETRRFDDKTNTTLLMRVKETGNDYRYFPEPDIPYIYLTDEIIKQTRENIPTLPDELRRKYRDLGLNNNSIKTIIANKNLCDFFENILNKCNPVIASNILTGDILSFINKERIELKKSLALNFIDLVNALDTKKITTNQAKEIIPTLLTTDSSIDEIIKKQGLEIVTDKNFLEKLIILVINKNEESVKDYKEGKDKAIKYLMGQIMKEAKGKINPAEASKYLIDKLNKL